MNDDWLNNPKLKNISKEKLEIFRSLASQNAPTDKNNLLPFIMSMKNKGRKKGLNFTQEEVTLILEAMKEGKSQAEVAKMNQLISMMSIMNKK